MSATEVGDLDTVLHSCFLELQQRLKALDADGLKKLGITEHQSDKVKSLCSFTLSITHEPNAGEVMGVRFQKKERICRLNISDVDLCSKLSRDDLRQIVAHEIGHFFEKNLPLNMTFKIVRAVLNAPIPAPWLSTLYSTVVGGGALMVAPPEIRNCVTLCAVASTGLMMLANMVCGVRSREHEYNADAFADKLVPEYTIGHTLYNCAQARPDHYPDIQFPSHVLDFLSGARHPHIAFRDKASHLRTKEHEGKPEK